MKYPTRFQQRTVWSAVTGLAILTLGSLLVGLVWLIGQIFGFLQPVLVPLIVAGIIAYLLDPVVRLIEKRGLSRLWSVIGVYIGILIVTTLLVVAVLPAIQGGKKFFRGMIGASVPTRVVNTDGEGDSSVEEPNLVPALARSLHHLRIKHQHGPVGWILTEIDDKGEAVPIDTTAEAPDNLKFFWQTRGGKILYDHKADLLELGNRWLSVGSSKVLGLLGLVLGMIMVPVYLFFFLKDSVSIREHWHEYMPLRASHFKTELVETLQEINGYLISFFRGQVLVGVIDGILVGLALFFFGLPYALLIGVFMAILGIIPYIGNILCLIPACIIAYLHAQTGEDVPFNLEPWPYVGCIILIFAGVQQINSLVTAPKIVGDSVGLHPLTVIFSMLFWSLLLGGFVGALLAVPLSAAVKVIFRRYFWEKNLLTTESEASPT